MSSSALPTAEGLSSADWLSANFWSRKSDCLSIFQMHEVMLCIFLSLFLMSCHYTDSWLDSCHFFAKISQLNKFSSWFTDFVSVSSFQFLFWCSKKGLPSISKNNKKSLHFVDYSTKKNPSVCTLTFSTLNKVFKSLSIVYHILGE